MTFVEGPLLRRYNLSTLRFETAGNSTPANAADMQLTGVVDAAGFRQEVLRRRNQLRYPERHAAAAGKVESEQVVLLRGISQRLDEILAVLRGR